MASGSNSRKKKASGSKEKKNMASGSSTACGDTTIVSPTRIHKATIVWLHDIGHNDQVSAMFVRKLNLPNVKWICPTVPTRPLTLLGGTQTTSWCDVTGISEHMEDDMVSINSTVAIVVNLLNAEPGNVMLGLGGIGMGAAVALYSATATCYITVEGSGLIQILLALVGLIET
ncbi:acyl-protein thioesterase 1-like [Capsella rubella]|uniref:acyl-protein thioesterase 1-like n=1 Tax=Capsella rubella TaxID=81985 RepID=UPI000CD5C0D4|nr:acyl-protein thioesterase 1-like [Capsella rubella]